MHLYHILQRRLVDTKIMPLNRLRETQPDLYTEYASKYNGREQVMQQRIPPPLDCLWNDVVFLSPIHPQDLLAAHDSIGAQLFKRAFIEFDVSKLDTSLMVVCTFGENEGTKHFAPFRPEDLAGYSQVPERTIGYWKRQVARRAQKLLFAYVPHIMYKGELDLTNTNIVRV